MFGYMSQAHRIYKMSFASIYPLYIQKAERKGRLKTEVNQIIQWLTGYNEKELDEQLKQEVDFETFIKEAPQLNPSRTLIQGVVCGVRVEDIKESTMQEIRYLDKMIDELASGKVMEKIGMKKEGILREHVIKWDKYEDVVSYGILKKEWENIIKKA